MRDVATEASAAAFTPEAIREIAYMSEKLNSETDNIGARRLSTVLSKIVEDVSFKAPTLEEKRYVIDEAYIESKLHDFVGKSDLTRYIL